MIEFAPLVAIWLATYLMHSTLLFGAAWLIERLGPFRTPAVREHLWRAAVLGALVTATAQSAGVVPRAPFLPLFDAPRTSAARAASPVPGPEMREAPSTAPLPAPSLPEGQAGVEVPPADTGPTPRLAAAPVENRSWRGEVIRPGGLLASRWSDWLTFLWLAGAGLAAMRLAALGWLSRRELGDRVPAEAVLAAEFDALCAAHGVRAPALSVAGALAGPISLPNGGIVVPPWAVASLDPRRHERRLAGRGRGDRKQL